VASYFLDSSALVKRYVLEPGTTWVRGLMLPGAGHDLFVARVTGAEVVAALLRHQPPLAADDLARALAHFQRDFRKRLQCLSIDRHLVAQAMLLAARHRLRGYDAIQLAAAVVARGRTTEQALLEPVFVSADDELNHAASDEGFPVDNPNSHP
jgi:predicted nucleic acid-binding protein